MALVKGGGYPPEEQGTFEITGLPRLCLAGGVADPQDVGAQGSQTAAEEPIVRGKMGGEIDPIHSAIVTE